LKQKYGVFSQKNTFSTPFTFLDRVVIMKIGGKLRRCQAISTDYGNVAKGKKNFQPFDLGQTQIDSLVLYLS